MKAKDFPNGVSWGCPKPWSQTYEGRKAAEAAARRAQQPQPAPKPAQARKKRGSKQVAKHMLLVERPALTLSEMKAKGWSYDRRRAHFARLEREQRKIMAQRVRYALHELPTPTVETAARNYSALARAIIAEVVADLRTTGDIAIAAKLWLFDEFDQDLVEWRQALCDLGDLSLDHLRLAANSFDCDQLFMLYAKLRGGHDGRLDIL